jgi:hypothetical protein
VVRTKERELLLVRRSNTILVISRYFVKTDKREAAGRVSKIVDGIVTAQNGVLKGKSGSFKVTI